MTDSKRIQRPFLKWAGAKTRLVHALKPLFPAGKSRLVEPFVGAGALFLNTDFSANLLCDSNRDLISVYQILQQNGVQFVDSCQALFTPENNREEKFYAIRTEFNRCRDAERRAALFIYLNRHCYNGLCRYNQDGNFNTPFGRYTRPYFPRKEMLVFGSQLAKASLAVQDFRVTIDQARAGDVVYCDPPYVALSSTANFTSYAAGGFSESDQRELAEVSRKAANRGVVVIISNHDTPYTRDLYASASELVGVMVQRNISCNGDRRTKARELIAVFSSKNDTKIRI